MASGTTRMLLVVDNAAGELMTGAFASVRLDLPNPEATMSVPASALIFDQSGLRVATVGPDNKVVLKPITISRDLGREVEIATGLAADDRIIESPPDGIANGDQVRIAGDRGNVAAGGPAPAKQAPSKPRGRPSPPPPRIAALFADQLAQCVVDPVLPAGAPGLEMIEDVAVEAQRDHLLRVRDRRLRRRQVHRLGGGFLECRFRGVACRSWAGVCRLPFTCPPTTCVIAT